MTSDCPLHSGHRQRIAPLGLPTQVGHFDARRDLLRVEFVGFVRCSSRVWLGGGTGLPHLLDKGIAGVRTPEEDGMPLRFFADEDEYGLFADGGETCRYRVSDEFELHLALWWGHRSVPLDKGERCDFDGHAA